MPTHKDLLEHLYDRFNARDIDAVLADMHPDVVWANGMDGGYEHGRDGVRRYWTRQWAMIDPHVEPIEFSSAVDGVTTVVVHQAVRDLEGRVLSDKIVHHIFRIEDELITRLDIR